MAKRKDDLTQVQSYGPKDWAASRPAQMARPRSGLTWKTLLLALFLALPFWGLMALFMAIGINGWLAFTFSAVVYAGLGQLFYLTWL